MSGHEIEKTALLQYSRQDRIRHNKALQKISGKTYNE